MEKRREEELFLRGQCESLLLMKAIGVAGLDKKPDEHEGTDSIERKVTLPGRQEIQNKTDLLLAPHK